MSLQDGDIAARLAALPEPWRWVLAARLKTLSLSQVPVLAGSWLALEAGHFRLDALLLSLIASGAIQLGTNLWNDAADAASGVDRPDRLGPPRMTALGLLDEASVRRAALGVFALAALAGLGLTMMGGWPIIAIGLVSLSLGYLYSMGPRPLSGLPFGELLVLMFFGIVAVSGTVLLHGGPALAPKTLVTGVMIGLPAAAVLLLNNHRDRVQDARAGRRTLAIVIGPTASRLAYNGALLVSLLLAVWLAPGIWLMPAAGLALWLAVSMWEAPISKGLNRFLALTSLFQALLFPSIVLGS